MSMMKNFDKKVKNLQKNEKAKNNFILANKIISSPFKFIFLLAKIPMFIGGFLFLVLAFKILTFNPTTELPNLEQEYQQMVEPAQQSVENSEIDQYLPDTNYDNAADAFNSARNSDARVLEAQVQFGKLVDKIKN